MLYGPLPTSWPVYTSFIFQHSKATTWYGFKIRNSPIGGKEKEEEKQEEQEGQED